MIVSKSLRLLVSAVLVSSTWPAIVVYAQATPADLPSDVMELIGRRSACIEWSQKVSDRERKAKVEDIRRILQSLKCDEVAHDESWLRQKYAGNSGILRALDAAWVKVIQRPPVQAPVPPETNR